MAHKPLPLVPPLPRPSRAETDYDRMLSRQLFQLFSEIAYILRNEVAEAKTTTMAGETNLMVFDVDNNTVERVTVGAANSGGAGFKLLRIPN